MGSCFAAPKTPNIDADVEDNNCCDDDCNNCRSSCCILNTLQSSFKRVKDPKCNNEPHIEQSRSATPTSSRLN